MSSVNMPDNMTQPPSNGPLDAQLDATVLLSNRYKVLNILGDGGFGKTFLVEDTHMPSNKRCVLKQLKPIHDKPELHQMVQDRFQREAATLETLGEAHDQIPRLHAYFPEGDQFYLVEEWVEGMTLTQKVHKDGPLSEASVQAIITNLLPVISFIHSQKIVHRDIKPDNIILRSQDGMPVLIDFGAVKETMKTIINSGDQSTHSIVVGTPGYMPSEQLSGRPIYASDIYSVGMTAIFLLTGKIPQELNTNPQTGALSWREHVPNLSTAFANFLDCATHMSPQSRFSTVQDMQSVLNTLMMGQMNTEVSAYETAQNKDHTVPPPIAPTAQPNSSQTVISSAPMAGKAAVAGAAMASATPSSTDSEINTAMVAPLAGVPTVNQPSSGAYPQPATASTQASSQWKGAVIVGGMVGLSILIAALVMAEGLPSLRANRSDTNSATTTEVIDPAAPSNDTDADATDADDSSNDESNREEDTKEPSTQTTTPVTPPVTTPVTPPAEAPGSNGPVVGQSGSKNIRSGAGTSFNVVDSVQPGNRIQVIDRANDSEGFPWYRVVTPSGTRGWIAGQLIQIDGDAAPPRPVTPKPTPTPTPTPPADRTNASIVSNESGSKNIRSGPGTNFSTQHIAYPGDRVIILDSANDSGGYVWYKVSFPDSGAQGWIAGQLIRRD
ncbi:MAG: serine/threonine protein kinase [Cyanobacteria bacterium P01_F01_bin.3]